ncbi:MAG: hypothetical protein AMXMBFR84_25830 [Candidatus Hydrogenedentota bacterium]
MASLEWKKDGRCYIVVKHKGKRTYHPILDKNGENPSKAHAQQRLKEFIHKENRVFMGLDPTQKSMRQTIAQLIPDYLTFAKATYVKNGVPTSQYANIQIAIDALKVTHGRLRMVEFTPDHLRDLQIRKWAHLSRQTVVHYTNAVKGFIKWCTAERGLNPDVLARVRAMATTRIGHATDPIQPVDWERQVLPIKPYLSQVLWDLIEVQYLTNARPGEWPQARPMDIDTKKGTTVNGVHVWTFIPPSHKTQHRGKPRVIFVGPKAQAILRPYLVRAKDKPLFSPLEAIKQKPAPKGHRRRLRQKRNVSATDRRIGDAYTTSAYSKAIARAVRDYNADHQDAPVDHWHPNQLRHTRTTEISGKHSQQAAGAVAGHARSTTTDIYDEAWAKLAAEVAAEEG